MITDQDVEKLKGTFATKDDLKVYATKDVVDRLEESLGDLRVEVGELHDKFDTLDVKFDAMLGLLTDSMQEHRMGAGHLARHDRQIGALAVVTGVTLPD